ncbi:transcription initiation factor TFIID subunit 1 [Eutrema salsugineum]|uniref:transcription initiation factor TFIID subunit 1 n=1 Tax=Eutrema salsugineum TaxID=72664 RepID=UPI000CECFDB8|nr:transcription initiation factor TFIID subunit 1 [Eutrema salsugineum]XP_024009213.1 transcription initiation factor TFIID subunit 1 [Eutrema salsugineum]
MAESNGQGPHNETSSDDDEEYEDNNRGFNLGFIFGNVDNSGDLDADYLDEDAKEHLSALADKLGSSLPDINLLAKSERTTSDPAEQDYDRKAEDAVDYEDIDEQYDGPEVQVVSEEDHLLPKRDYFSAAVSLGSLNSRASVFDDEDYDEEEEPEEEHAPVEKSFETEKREPVVLKEDKALEYEEATILENEDQMDTEDVQEEEVDEFLEDTLDEKRATPLPTLYVEDGMVILQFSEIFAIHEPPQKRERRENRYITCRDKYNSMDISELVEDDDEVLLKSHGRVDAHVNQADLIQLDVTFPIKDGLQLLKSGTMDGTAPESRDFTKLGRDSCIMGELLKQDLIDDNSSLCQSQLSVEVFPLDQHEWEHRILWENSPEISGNSGEDFETGLELEGMLVEGTNSEAEQESLIVMNKKAQADNNMPVPFSANLLESFGPRGSQSANESTNKSRHHPQLLRLESQWDENHLGENDNVVVQNIKRLESDALGRFSRLGLQERDSEDEAWLNSIIWDSDKELSRSKLIFDLQDEQMVFEILDNEESKNLQLHAGAMIVSGSSKSKDESFQEGFESNSGWQFNISNDKFYMNGKSSQQLQANTNQSGVMRVFHSAPAIKLQTMKSKLSNKDIANFHRPKALWYPHDNELAIKQQGTLPTRGSMKIVVKSLGGKGSKLHVGIEETVSSLKVKASRKLDFKETEAVKMFYKGKELEDEKSLAVENVQPNSLVHLVRTKVHLWPRAQKLPGENKSLRPPGAFKKKSDLSTKDGHVFLMEYCEERPLMLSNAGMGAKLCTYYQKSSPEDQHGNLLRNQSDTLGNVIILEPGDKSPFLGEIHAGCSQASVETNMYKAPVFPQRLQSTDYLLVRSPKGKLSLRRIDKIVVVGQQEPRMEVMSPGSKNLQTYLVNRMMVYVYREFLKRGERHSIAADELSFLFSNLTDAIVKRNMKGCAYLKRDKNGQPCWFRKKEFKDPTENELKKLVAPEHVCSYESMLAGLYRLKHLGITRFTLPASISAALAQLPDEAIALAAASHIERELQITPWNLSSNFVACTNQDRANIERLEITGVGDPSGRGLGFSYVRAAPKAPAAAGHMKKKAAAGRGAPTVTGTDADLRRLSMEAAREVLLKFNVPDEIIAKQTRWHRIAMIRKLSSEQAASGVKVDPTTIGKYARGQRMSFLQMQQQAREKCQEIWDRQLLSLSAFDGDDNESENEANSDLDSFAGDLENLLDAEEGGEGEESTMSKNDKLDGVKGLKMRRRPSQVETDEEIEDEATEYAELCRLLMQDEEQKKKKKKLKGVGEGMGSFPPPRPNVVFQNNEPVRKTTVNDKKPIAIQPDASFLVNESTVKDTRNVDSPIVKTPKGKQVKESSNSLSQLRKVKIVTENLKVFKEKKSARENFVCGACGQHGHMRTNKHCPRYRENTESQPEGIDMEKSAGKPSSSEVSGPAKLKPIKNSKAAPKSAVKVPVDEAPKGENSTSKTGVLPLRFRYGIPAGAMSDKSGLEAPESSEQAPVSDIDIGTKPTPKISKLKISSKARPKESKIEPDRPPHSLMPTYSRERGESGSHKPSISGQHFSSAERNQGASSRNTISIPQPSLSMDRDQAESRRPHLVIRPPTEREQPQKKLVIKRSKDITDHDMSSLEESPRFESRKTKRMAELAGYQRQQSFRFSENSLEMRPKEDRVWWEQEEISRGRHRESIDYDDMIVSEEPNEIAEIRRYEEVIRSEREEEERQKAKKKKKKKKLQPELIEGYLEDYPPRRNDRRLSERGRNVRSRYVSDLELNGVDYAPQPKRRKKGEVGLANILESIVDTLRLKEEVSRLFLKPVSKKEAPDYLDVVERPMDLSTIRDKVRKIEYRDREQFRHDVWQIKFNAHLYNDGRNPGIPPLADQLLEICDYLLDDYNDQLTEAEKGIDPND